MGSTTVFPVKGVRLAAVAAHIKKPDVKDLVVIELAQGSHVAGVFTLNRFCAAPVQVAKNNLAKTTPRYLMVNTGYANAGTGEQGMSNCLATCELLAKEANCSAEQVLPFSTGVIGELFSLPPFESGLPVALAGLSETAWEDAAAGIMTTDTQPKFASEQININGETVTITGMSKGSGMIKPNMATMLGFICTDAKIAPDTLQQWSAELANQSFNQISVDGDTSTNDACMLVATGQSGVSAVSGSAEGELLYQALLRIYQTLAQAIVRDGEGATKFVEVKVSGALTESDARIVAETVAHSPLVKTALFASDPNWGRILAAVGRAPIAELDVDAINIFLGDVQIVANGGVAADYVEQAGSDVMAQEDIVIHIDLASGSAKALVWTCDFSYDYVRINAEYRT